MIALFRAPSKVLSSTGNYYSRSTYHRERVVSAGCYLQLFRFSYPQQRDTLARYYALQPNATTKRRPKLSHYFPTSEGIHCRSLLLL